MNVLVQRGTYHHIKYSLTASVKNDYLKKKI